jgi:2-polyprenyl-3-methyl-5-hydroxy-6-metoxy-1,4-benzoquinol methylase
MIKVNSANCPLCNDSAQIYWSKIGIFRCINCGLLFRDVSDNAEALNHLYKESWLSPIDHANETGGTTYSLARQYLKFLCKSLNIINLEGLRILDFGAGSGIVSEVLGKDGAFVTAVDPYSYESISKLGIPSYRTLNEIPERSRIFDGVVSFEVVEHLQEPLKDFKIINSFLKPNGWVYISTPNCQGLNARLRGDHWREALKFAHIALYNQKSLSKLLFLAGFTGKRLKWSVKYQDSKFIQIKDYLLQQFLLDGDLRMLAFLDR